MLTALELAATAAYLTDDDHLRLRVRNSAAGVTVAIEGRYALPDGTVIPFGDVIVPATDRSASMKLIRMTKGLLLTVSVRASAGAPRRGQTFVTVELVRGFTGDVQPLGVLIQGYVSDTTRRQWPGSLLEDSTDGRGVVRNVAGADPAAAAEATITVPTAARWRLIAFTVTLVTDANAANREPILVIDDGATVAAAASPAAVQAASLTRRHTFGPASVVNAAGALAQQGATPHDVLLPAGYRLSTVTANLQAGDNYGVPQAFVEEWIEP